MRYTKKIFTVFLAVCCVMSVLCGCSAGDRSQEAKSLCETFCTDVKAGEISKLVSYFDYGTITDEELAELIAPSDFNKEEAAFAAAIKESTDFSVQDPVYDKNTKTATVYVVWKQGDFSSDAALSATSVEEFKTALSSSSSKNITVNVTVDLSGEFARIKNPKDTVDAVYAYNTINHGIMPGLLSDFYTDSNWTLAPKGVYTNVKEIGLRVNFNNELSKYRFIPGVYYTVSRGGEVIYTSDIMDIEDNSIRLDYTIDMAGAGDLNEDGFITDGKYSVMVFDAHSKQICTSDCEVVNEILEKEEIVFEEYKKDHYLTDLVYDIKDSDLMANSFVFNTGWWDYDGTSVGKSAFASNTKTLGFSLAVSSTNDNELYYDYYYSEKSDFKDVNETEPVFSASCKPTVYDDQSCYDIDYTPAEMKPGFYGLVVYGDAGRKHIVFTAACIVVEETSGDVID